MKIIGKVVLFLAWISVMPESFPNNTENDIPTGFGVLSEKSGMESMEMDAQSLDNFNIKLTNKEKAQGFFATVTTTTEPTSDERTVRTAYERNWTEAVANTDIELFGTPGEYRNFAIAIKALKAIKGLNFECSPLEIDTTHMISNKNIKITRIVMFKQYPKYLGHFLDNDFPLDIPSGNTIWLWGTIFIPSDAKQGNYKGKLNIFSITGEGTTFLLNLNVLNFKLETSPGAWGICITGHLYNDKSGRTVYASPELTKENLPTYFRFLKTLKMNSLTVCHTHPEFKLINGIAETRFTDLQSIAMAMKKEGFDKCLFLGDTYFFQWWARAAALKYEKMISEKKDVSGDIGIYCRNAIKSPAPYSEKAKEIYRDTITQLFETAQKEKWPPIYVCPQDEPSNVNSLDHDTFAPIVKKIAPDRTIITDNDLGYGRKNAIDRGARDGIKIREYASWEDEAIDRTIKEGAIIWNYNNGYDRAAYGFLQERLNSSGYMNWADQWIKPSEWVYSIITKRGIITSAEFERAREGLFDREYCTTLKVYAERLKKAGYEQAGQDALKKLKDLVAEIPVGHWEFASWKKNTSSKKLDNMRWIIVQEIIKARKILEKNTDEYSLETKGSPSFIGVSPIYKKNTKQSLRQSAKMLKIPYLTTPVIVDGILQEACWNKKDSNSTGPLGWMINHEEKMRVAAGSEEAFQKMPKPSWTNAAFAYDDNGLYIGCTANNLSPSSDKISKRSDDDAELWKDNCMEFFFKKSDANGSETYQLIVNTHGKKTMMKKAIHINPFDIKVAVKENVNPSGAFSMEIFIPWKTFELENTPLQGTSWRANVGREFHSYNQYLSWASVYCGFMEEEYWNSIIFGGISSNVDIIIPELCTFPGKNTFVGKIIFKSQIPSSILSIVLKNSAGEILKRVPLTEQKGKKEQDFSISYEIPHIKTHEEWSFDVIDPETGTTATFFKFPLWISKTSVIVNKIPNFITAGEKFEISAMFCIGTEEYTNCTLEGEFINKIHKDHRIKIKSINLPINDSCIIWVDSSGLTPGKYLLKIWLSSKNENKEAFEKEIEVLPAY